MIYVPILKLRSIEQKALNCVAECLSDKIIPLIEIIEDLYPTVYCQTAHCGRGKPHFDFGNNISPIVRYRHLPQTLIGMTVDCCSLV